MSTRDWLDLGLQLNLANPDDPKLAQAEGGLITHAYHRTPQFLKHGNRDPLTDGEPTT